MENAFLSLSSTPHNTNRKKYDNKSVAGLVSRSHVPADERSYSTLGPVSA